MGAEHYPHMPRNEYVSTTFTVNRRLRLLFWWRRLVDRVRGDRV